MNRAADILSDKVPLLVIKRGADGAFARRGKETFTAAPFKVEMVDPIGAGDSFDAGFIHQFVRGQGIETCLRFANVTGALCATRAGGTEAFRDAAHRDRFLARKLERSAYGESSRCTASARLTRLLRRGLQQQTVGESDLDRCRQVRSRCRNPCCSRSPSRDTLFAFQSAELDRAAPITRASPWLRANQSAFRARKTRSTSSHPSRWRNASGTSYPKL